ncbi:MAG: regulatory protein RecX [Odoribacter splanchnicus]
MNKEKALSLAAAICSKKEHCSWEIQEKLVKWEIPEKEIDRIMTFLHQHRFIDDARYAKPMPKISSGSTIGENRK